ncbi:hypothetical protein MCOR25_008702 [Pyricularia grisea]|nr:hypothetical protein MCOR25_008702 [Pyricularia grisea]
MTFLDSVADKGTVHLGLALGGSSLASHERLPDSDPDLFGDRVLRGLSWRVDGLGPQDPGDEDKHSQEHGDGPVNP